MQRLSLHQARKTVLLENASLKNYLELTVNNRDWYFVDTSNRQNWILLPQNPVIIRGLKFYLDKADRRYDQIKKRTRSLQIRYLDYLLCTQNVMGTEILI